MYFSKSNSIFMLLSVMLVLITSCSFRGNKYSNAGVPSQESTPLPTRSALPENSPIRFLEDNTSYTRVKVKQKNDKNFSVEFANNTDMKNRSFLEFKENRGEKVVILFKTKVKHLQVISLKYEDDEKNGFIIKNDEVIYNKTNLKNIDAIIIEAAITENIPTKKIAIVDEKNHLYLFDYYIDGMEGMLKFSNY